MKRVIQHPAPSSAELNGPRYWRSLEELADTPEFRERVAREFPAGAAEMDGVDRRHFMKIMASSFALGGLTMAGCRRPEARILPYHETPEHTIPGLPLFFATAMPLRRHAVPVVVETHQGRPTKIEGNPSYAPYGGATNVITQASVLDLYDVDRATTHRQGTSAASVGQVTDFLNGVLPRFAAGRGAGLAFLSEQSSSPTRRRLVRALKDKLPQAIWAEYEPVDQTTPERVASQVAGRPVKPHYDFKEAARVVAFDADFIGAEDDHIRYAREFAATRRVAKSGDAMSRLYAIESTMTLVGGMADHRLRAATSQMTSILAQLALAVGVPTSDALTRLAGGSPVDAEWIRVCAEDLRAHQGRSLVMPGSHLPDAAHAIALLINQALGALGKTVTLLATEANVAASINDLAAAITAGSVQTLFVLGGNPAYNAPAELKWSELQGRVGEVVRVGYHEDETSQGAAWHVASTHYLESWGDARTVDGTIVAVQPMIEPLFGGMSEIEVLARVVQEANPDAHSQVVATFGTLVNRDVDQAFRAFLHEGLLPGSAWEAASANVNAGRAAAIIAAATASSAPGASSLEVRFAADYKIDDGRFGNNGWLQECPDPITKLTWDNAIIISPRLAAELGIVASGSALQIVRKNPNTLKNGVEIAPWAKITVGGQSVEGPIHIQPGLDSYTVVLPLGYGRTRTGRIGTGAGFTAYALRTGGAASVSGGTIELVAGESRQLANTQEHWSMEGRAIVREANLDEYTRDPGFAAHLGMESHSPAVLGVSKNMSVAERSRETPRGNSLYEHENLTGTHQWGMSIDLNTCTGCNACVVACQAENNIPIIGRDQVRRGREMHWIRLDRYYSDGRSEGGAFGGPNNAIIPEDPQVSLQPVACMQCETAPCETVCPVNATVHDEEGLNVMAYNRCVGTRYCANNCPYKVRRFNFFDFNQRQLDSLYLGPLGPKGMPELVQMVKNPDVTVRMRGVMEKCTYCTQRIQEAKIQQKVKARDSGDVKVPDGHVKTACQQVCPTEAIVFGDVTDPASAVSVAKANSRNYELLGYLNIRPRTTYLARVRNPNLQMPEYAKLEPARQHPFSRQEYDVKNGHAGGGHHGGDAHAVDHAAPGAADGAATSHDGGHH